MSRVKKYILLAASVVLMGAIAAGVAFYAASFDPSNPDPGLYVDDKQALKLDDVVMTFGEYEVTLAEYRYYYFSTMSYTDQMAAYQGTSAPDWHDDPDGDVAYELQEMVEADLLNLHTWLAIGKQNGIELSEEDLSSIDEAIAAQKEEMGEDGLLAQMKNVYIEDEAVYRQLIQKQRLAQKVQEQLTEQLTEEHGDAIGDEADEAYEAENVTIKHILFMSLTDAEYAAQRAALEAGDEDASASPTSSSSDASQTEEEPNEDETAALALQAQEDTLARAQAMYAQIMASDEPVATFDEMMQEYSEDGGLAANPTGYTFIPDASSGYVEPFYTTAAEMEIDEISQPVWQDGSETGGYSGYHILMRTPLDADKIAANRESVISTRISEMLNEVYTAAEPGITVTYNAYYYDITPSNMI